MFSNTRHSINIVLVIVAGLICLLGSILIIPGFLDLGLSVAPSILPTATELLKEQVLLPASPTPIVPTEQVIFPIPTQTLEILSLPVVPRGLITNGTRDIKKIALTFDVCQAEGDISGYDSAIIRVLTKYNAPATFFLGGAWIRDHPEEAKELAQNPQFELGNHSWSHADFSKIDVEKMTQEIDLAQDELFALTGRKNRLFRLPYGFYTDDALGLISDKGLYTIQWDVVSGDPDPNITAVAMIDWVLRQVQPGSIIIMHANGRGWHTAEALPAIIDSLLTQGYSLVTVSELLNITP